MKEDNINNWGLTSIRASRDCFINDSLKLRSNVIFELRKYLIKKGFIEVDTPILRYAEDPTDNPPFITFGSQGWPRLHLRTCTEEYTRRAACAFDSVFEIGKCFRNETINKSNPHNTHLTEFTMIEMYQANANLDQALLLMEETIHYIIAESMGVDKVSYQGIEVDFNLPFKRIKVLDAIDEFAGGEATDFTRMHRNASDNFIVGEDVKLNRYLDDNVKPKIFNPTFLTHYPRSADQYPDVTKNNEVLRAELVCCGIEIGEVGELQPRFDILDKHIRSAINDRHGQENADQLVDNCYLDEIKYFNKNIGGGAFGIDRLLMLLCNTKDVREVVWYPLISCYNER